MLPDDVEVYENGDTGLEIHDIDGEKRYWIRGGVGTIWFDEQGISDLTNLLIELKVERTYQPEQTFLKIAALGLLVAVVVAIAVVVMV